MPEDLQGLSVVPLCLVWFWSRRTPAVRKVLDMCHSDSSDCCWGLRFVRDVYDRFHLTIEKLCRSGSLRLYLVAMRFCVLQDLEYGLNCIIIR